MQFIVKKNLVIFGAAEQAELAHYYFSQHSYYQVVAFAVDAAYLQQSQFCGLPILPFEGIDKQFSPHFHDFFVALGYSKLNQNRREKYLVAKALGYRMASYISPAATKLNNGKFGDNCFVLEDNTIQPFVTIGNNVTLWSGNHIGHHSTIHDHCFIASHVVISGGVEIGESCFVGVNATLRDHIRVGSRCVIGAGALLLADAEPNGVYIGQATARSTAPSNRLGRI